MQTSIRELVGMLQASYPGLPNARWVALRLLGGDEHVAEALRNGELADLYAESRPHRDPES